MALSFVSWICSAIQMPILAFFIYKSFQDPAESSCPQNPSYDGLGDSSPVMALRVAAILGFLVAVGSLLNSFLLLNLYPSFRDGAKTNFGLCAGCCGCEDALHETEGGDDNIGDEVSSIMTRIFGPMPLVATDLFAGMIFVSAYQRRCREAPTLGPIAETSSITAAEVEMVNLQQSQSIRLNTPGVARPVDVSTLHQAKYYLRYAHAAYGEDVGSAYGDFNHSDSNEGLSSFQPVSSDHTIMARSWVNPLSDWWQMLLRLTHLQQDGKATDQPVPEPPQPPPPPPPAKTKPEPIQESERMKQWRALLIKQLGLEDESLLYLQLENKALGTVPYFIALDHRRQSIVLSIRGSASLQDAFTDMITTPAPMSALLSRGGLWAHPEVEDDKEQEGEPGPHETSSAPFPAPQSATLETTPEMDSATMSKPPAVVTSGATSAGTVSTQGAALPGPMGLSMTARADSIHWQSVVGASAEASNVGAQAWDEFTYPGGYAHRGILVSAIRLLDDLKLKGHFGAAVNQYPDWKVVITGHSLGAGLAALLAMALHQDLKERLHCWAFCPPGGLMSVKRALEGSKYITSVVHASDPVSRATWRSLEMLRDQLMLSLALSKVGKTGLWWRCLRDNRKRQLLDPDELLHHDIPQDHDILAHLHKYRRLTQRAKLWLAGADNLRFWVPGKIMYLCPRGARGEASSAGAVGAAGGSSLARPAAERTYDGKWVSYETIEAEGLVVGENTVEDHLLFAVHAAICSSIATTESAAN